jgi:hypothetical protein
LATTLQNRNYLYGSWVCIRSYYILIYDWVVCLWITDLQQYL